MRPYLDLLRRERDFRRTFLATLVASGADWFAVIPLLVLLDRLTGSPLAGALVLAADTLVFALVSPWAGAVVDRLDRRKVLVVGDLAAACAALLLVLVDDAGDAWIAVVGIGLVAACKAFSMPAGTAATPNLVDAADLPTASVLSGASWGTMLAVGAALGGLLSGAAGADACFVLVAVLLLLSAYLVSTTTRPFQEPREPAARSSAGGDVREALAYARTDRRVLALMTCKTGPAFGNGALSLFPAYGAAAFGLGPAGIGLLYSARGVGALLGPLLLRRRAASGRLQPVLVGSMAVFGVAYLGLAFAPWFALALVCLAVAHAGGGANWILSTYGLQAVVPDRLRGRVFAVDTALATLVIAGSQVVFGLLAATVPARGLLAGGGAAVLGYALAWGWVTRRAGLVRIAEPPAGGPSAEAGPCGVERTAPATADGRVA